MFYDVPSDFVDVRPPSKFQPNGPAWSQQLDSIFPVAYKEKHGIFKYLVLSCLALSCLDWSCAVLSCLALSCRVLSCLELCCLVLSSLVLSCHVQVAAGNSESDCTSMEQVALIPPPLPPTMQLYLREFLASKIIPFTNS
jgi:hypothetical protein